MEIFTIVLSSLITLISPVGFIVDNVAADNLRSQVKSVEQLRVRIDNRPTYQILQGKAETIKVATRGLKPVEELRIEALELESDRLNVDIDKIRKAKNWSALRESLKEPLQGGIRLVLTEADLNQTLNLPSVLDRLKKILASLGENKTSTPKYELIDPKINFLGDNRFGVQVRLVRIKANGEKAPPLDLDLRAKIEAKDGNNLQIVEPIGTINGKTISNRLLLGFAEGISDRLKLSNLERYGIVARLLQLDINESEINLAAFVRVDRKI